MKKNRSKLFTYIIRFSSTALMGISALAVLFCAVPWYWNEPDMPQSMLDE